jgi:hypothetical protein
MSLTKVTYSMIEGSPANVLDYGADPTGLNDSTAAIQAAVNAATRVYIPAGVYLVTQVNIADSVVLFGDGIESEIKHKDGAATVSYTTAGNRMFVLAAHNISVLFESLCLNGNYTGQGSANGGNATATTNSFVSGGVITLGTCISFDEIAPASAYDRLILKVDKCTFKNVQFLGIGFSGSLDSTAYEELTVTNSNFNDIAPGIIPYDAGVPVGYVGYALGFDPSFISVTNSVNLTVDGCEFKEYRDPTVSPTPTYTMNVYNFPANAIRITGSTTDPTPEWSKVCVVNNSFDGTGRPPVAENIIGTIDCYLRAELVRIGFNQFDNNWSAAIRGKTNARDVSIIGNTIRNTEGGGINFARLTYPIQDGRFVISGNSIDLKPATDGTGISVIGDITVSPFYTEDIIIDSNIIHNSDGTDQAAILAVDVKDIKITNNIARNSTGTRGGIYCDRVHGKVLISDNSITDTTVAQAIRFVVGSSYPYVDLKVTNNQIENSFAEAILLSASGGASIEGVKLISGNTIKDCSDIGVEISLNEGVTIVKNNVLQNITGTGISISYTAQAVGNNLTVNDNDVDGAVNYGILSDNAQEVVCNGNKVANISGLGRGFYHLNTVNDCLFVGNYAVTSVATPVFNSYTTTPRLRETQNSWNSSESFNTAAPSAATWNVGDIVWNLTPVSGGNIGWVCTVAGTPGTWNTFGVIS